MSPIYDFTLISDNMSEFIKNATDLIEQGHVRVGTEVVKDPAFLVSRTLEDFVTWVDSSKIRRHVMEYNNMVRDLELLQLRPVDINFACIFACRETILNCKGAHIFILNIEKIWIII